MEYTSGPSSQQIQNRRPDVKKKLVVVGDGAQGCLSFVCSGFVAHTSSWFTRWLWQDMFTHCIRGEPLPRGMYTAFYRCRLLLTYAMDELTHIGICPDRVRKLRHARQL